MPIIDSRRIEHGANLSCDICIIGAGAAGISITLELSKTPLSVILLESGGKKSDRATQELYEGEVAGTAAHSPPLYYRKRQFGGTTTVWGGACVPFDPIDYEERSFLPHSGWPFGSEEVERHYPRACELLEAGAPCFRMPDALPGRPREMISSFTSPCVGTDSIERSSRPTNFARRYTSDLRNAPRLRVLLHGTCTRLAAASENQTIDRIDVTTLAGNKFTVSARHFVLAAGGLEVARLLLASHDIRPQGIGNDNDLVGRFYMCHLASTVGRLQFHVPASRIMHGYEQSPDRIYCRRRFSITPEVQKKLEIGNIVFRLVPTAIADPSHRSGGLSALFLAQGLLPFERKKWSRGVKRSPSLLVRHFRNMMTDPFGASAFTSHVIFRRILARRKYPAVTIQSPANRYSLEFIAEQAPLPESRVRLSDQRDRFGMPRLSIDWRYADFDVRTVKCAYQILAEEFERTGVGRLDYSDEMLEEAIARDGAFDGHHIGTTRMSDDPSTGVVDRNCRVHQTENLYVASASVFPTSSHANPTLMIVAMALRLASHLQALTSLPTPLAAEI